MLRKAYILFPVLSILTFLPSPSLHLFTQETIPFTEYKYSDIPRFNREMISNQSVINIIELSSLFPQVRKPQCGKDDCNFYMYEMSNSNASQEKITQMPYVLIFSGMDGSETLAINSVFQFIRTAINGFSFNEDWYNLISNSRVFIIPVMNPSGFFNNDKFERIYTSNKLERVDPRTDFNWKKKNSCFVSAASQYLYLLHQMFTFQGVLEVASGQNTIFYPGAGPSKSNPEDNPENSVYQTIGKFLVESSNGNRKDYILNSKFAVSFNFFGISFPNLYDYQIFFHIFENSKQTKYYFFQNCSNVSKFHKFLYLKKN